MQLINPANETFLGHLVQDSSEMILEKYNKVVQAQKEWKKVGIKDRIQWISKYKKLLLQNIDHLALTLTEDMGKPLSQSKGEIKGAMGRLDYFINHCEQYLSTETVNVSETHTEMIAYEPLGVIANISAWNFPYNIGFNVFIPAIVAGNGVLYKPSEFCSRTGEKMISLLFDAGVPKNLVKVIQGGGKTGAALLDLDIDAVYFTGSHKTGQSIYNKVASKMIPCQLELGGKDPLYITADNANLISVVDSAIEGVFWNNGQSCCAVERIYVHHSLYDQFLDLFVQKVNAMKIGNPMDDDTFIGPLARKQQINILQSQVDDALAKGATVLTGGKALECKGYYYMPTVVSNVDHTMSIMNEESFGPIIGIQKVASDEEAIKLMKDSKFGLSSAVFSDKYQTAKPILDTMDTGTVYWNCCDRVSPYTPWSGRHNSGIGSTLSHIGIRAFTQPKAYQLKSFEK
ncbi:MAG: aldehyde dehydrogenase family protein [Saprospiraceae bacterium]|nr:aldehyde dehydrogenase family protein [Saprospiraceae bacterium]